MLTAVWWTGRIVVLLSVAWFYWRYAIGEALGNQCDQPLFMFIITEGGLSLLHMLLRSASLVVGFSDEPDTTVKFLLLYPVILHIGEVMMAVDAGATILQPEPCELPRTQAYVHFSCWLCFAIFVVAGVVFPIMFQTRVTGMATDRVTLAVDPNASRHGAGRFLRSYHAYFLLYRTAAVSIMFVTYLISRDDASEQKLVLGADRWSSSCTDPLKLWVFIELLLYLVSYLCTMCYAVRALLYPLFNQPLAKHEQGIWLFILMQFVSGLAGIKLVHSAGVECQSSPAYYMAYAGAVCFFSFFVFSLCMAPYWRPWMVARRMKAKQGQMDEKRRVEYELQRQGGGHGGATHVPLRTI